MPVQILRRRRAIEDAHEIVDFIAADSVAAARRFIEQLDVTIELLRKFPQLGNPYFSPRIPIGFRRIRVCGFHHYNIYYQCRGDTIEICRILHGARDVGSELKKR